MPPQRSREADGDASPAEVARSFSFERLPEGFHDDPYRTYAALREHDPVHRLDAGKILVSRYADVERIYKDPKTFSSDKTVEFGAKYGASPLYEHHTTSLVFNDPPLHTRVRRLLAGALNPRAIAGMEDGVVRLVDGLLDDAEEKREIDLIDDFAAAIPVEVIGNLLYVPAASADRCAAGRSPSSARSSRSRRRSGSLTATAPSSTSSPISRVLSPSAGGAPAIPTRTS